jgi:hydrogenase 3 maturation protease
MKEVILGVGNALKGDDGIGVYIAEKINTYLKEIEKRSKGAKRQVIALDCGTTPENYTSTIRRHNPDKLILVDAADMGLSPGSYRIIPPEKIEVMHFSTHDMPLSLFISYVGGFCGEVILIGIQPEKMDFGTPLSSVVQRNGDRVANLILEKQLNKIEPLEA